MSSTPTPYRDNPSAAAEEGEGDDGVIETGERTVKRVWGGFLDFALQGNILEIAIGLMLVALDSALPLPLNYQVVRCIASSDMSGCLFLTVSPPPSRASSTRL